MLLACEKCQNTFSGITLKNLTKKVKKHFIVQYSQIIVSEYVKKCIHLLIYDRILYVMQILEVFGICFCFVFYKNISERLEMCAPWCILRPGDCRMAFASHPLTVGNLATVCVS